MANVEWVTRWGSDRNVMLGLAVENHRERKRGRGWSTERWRWVERLIGKKDMVVGWRVGWQVAVLKVIREKGMG